MSEEEKYKCEKPNCEWCRIYALRENALASDDIDVVKKALEEFSDMWLAVDCDLTYYRCILDGSWPGSVQRLEEASKIAKIKNVQ